MSEQPPPPTVFISYSHDSEEHKNAVFQLAQQLRSDGINCTIDQFLNRGPKKGWPRWMREQVEESDFVLVVCTERYKRRFEGREDRGKGQGANWEGILIEQVHYQADATNEKFLPVLLEEADPSAIPLSLRPFTHYRLPTGYVKLLRGLFNKPAVVPARIGQQPTLASVIGGQVASKQRPIGPAPALSSGTMEFSKLLAVIELEDYTTDKLTVIEHYVKSVRLSMDQAAKVLATFDYSYDKLKAFTLIEPQIFSPQQISLVLGQFDYSSDKLDSTLAI
jgi:hypothetical protein